MPDGSAAMSLYDPAATLIVKFPAASDSTVAAIDVPSDEYAVTVRPGRTTCVSASTTVPVKWPAKSRKKSTPAVTRVTVTVTTAAAANAG